MVLNIDSSGFKNEKNGRNSSPLVTPLRVCDRQAILQKQWFMMKKKAIRRTWLRHFKEQDMTLEDWLWTEDDMDHFLQTVASYETHKASPVIKINTVGLSP